MKLELVNKLHTSIIYKRLILRSLVSSQPLQSLSAGLEGGDHGLACGLQLQEAGVVTGGSGGITYRSNYS